MEGKRIHQCLREKEGQITLLNDGLITHILEGHTLESIFDLTFVDNGSALDYSWTVRNDNWGSDHLPIGIEKNTKLDPRESNKKKTPRIHKHMNWFSFTECIKLKIGRLGELGKWNRSDSSIERYDTLVKAIKESMEECSLSNRRDRDEKLVSWEDKWFKMYMVE
jgi:hypothetical protein